MDSVDEKLVLNVLIYDFGCTKSMNDVKPIYLGLLASLILCGS